MVFVGMLVEKLNGWSLDFETIKDRRKRMFIERDDEMEYMGYVVREPVMKRHRTDSEDGGDITTTMRCNATEVEGL